MKTITNIIQLFLIGLIFIGCGSDDSNPLDLNNPVSGFSRVDFTIQGAERNGSLSIIDNLTSSEINSFGTVYHTEEGDLASFGYSDEIQELSANFMILGGTGTQNFSLDSLQDDGVFALQLIFDTEADVNNNNHFIVKDLTVTVTEYETQPFVTTFSLLKRIKGTFSGTVIAFEELLGENQNTHTIEGTFYYVMED